jgi:hypothetical protein
MSGHWVPVELPPLEAVELATRHSCRGRWRVLKGSLYTWVGRTQDGVAWTLHIWKLQGVWRGAADRYVEDESPPCPA